MGDIHHACFWFSGLRVEWDIKVVHTRLHKIKIKKMDPKSSFLGGDSEHDPYFDIKALLGRGSLRRGAL